jgi:hypothetical protein
MTSAGVSMARSVSGSRNGALGVTPVNVIGWIYLVGSTAVRGKIPRERADRGEGPRDRQEGVGEP